MQLLAIFPRTTFWRWLQGGYVTHILCHIIVQKRKVLEIWDIRIAYAFNDVLGSIDNGNWAHIYNTLWE